MIQYLINLTSIWLVSLLVFDLFLKKETYHTYNRLFLNGALLLGIFLPLWSWQQDSVIYASNIGNTITMQAAVLKETVVSNTQNTVIGWEAALWVIYGLGAIIVSSIIIKELLTIHKLYKNGTKYKNGVWTVIEINKNISPFSAFRYVFISNKEDYSNEELQIILAHEQQHGHLLHFVDLLLVNLIKIVFWFNPLIYILEKRLLMVHEYQADAGIEGEATVYGKFLVEQSILKSAPILSHSFIRSPLKSRIKMLTKQSKKIASLKQLIIAPLVLFIMLCFTQNTLLFAQERKVDGNKITYKGNVFEKVFRPADTVFVTDPVTGKQQMILTTRDYPITKMNGQDIMYQYYNTGTLPLEVANFANKIKAEVGNDIAKEISKIKKLDGSTFQYNINQLVVDDKGKVVYYELSATKYIVDKKNQQRSEIPADIRGNISTKISNILEHLNASIFYKDGVATPYVLAITDEFILE